MIVWDEIQAKIIAAGIILLGQMAKAEDEETFNTATRDLQNVCLVALGEAPVTDLDDVLRNR